MKKIYLLFAVVAVALLASSPRLSAVTLAWDSSSSTNVVGYVVHYGGTSGSYPNATNVSQTSASVAGLQSGQTYYFAVSARDALGVESVLSNEVGYQVPATTLPTVALTSPLGGTSYAAPASINLAASVTANGHTITKVQFYNGATLLAEDISSPYSYTWSSVSAGSYSLTARVVYDAGSTLNSTAASVTVTDPSLPMIVLTSPATGTSYTSPATVNLAASVTANGHTITKVQFYNGATLLGEGTSAPYSYAWNSVSAGSYSLTARVVYDAGSTLNSTAASVTVNNLSSPTIVLTSPATGTSYTSPATVNLAASVTANGHTITKVQFYNAATLLGEDTASPYSFTWNSVSAGSYSLTARVVYDAGSTLNSTAASVTVLTPPPTTVGGLVAAYSFNEGAGTTVTDASGSGNNGTIGTATWTTAGKYGKALSFNGSGARVTVNDANSLDLTTGMTLEAWVNPTAVGGWRDVIYKGPDDLYYLMGSSDISTPALGGTFATALRGTASLPLNTWTHLAGTYDGATLRLYVNGVQLSSRAQTGPIQTSTDALTIGGDALYGQSFAGQIDEVRVYNRALSASELQTDMNTPVGTTVINPNPTLPAPWQTADIGTVALAGNASESSGVYTVQGSGSLANVKADSFRFVYQPLSADGNITARINSMTTDGANRCVGVMIRESLAPNSRYTFMGIGQNLTFRWQRRNNTGGSVSSTTSVLSAPPNAWTRVVRANNTFTAYSSPDGANWTQINSASITMAANIYVGLVVASGDTNTKNTSVFSNVSVTP